MLQDLIRQFGYPALVLGTFLEGEVSLLLAAYMAVRNVLEIEWVALCAFLGTFASDQLWYYLGRRHGRALLERKPRWQPLGERASALIKRYPDLWVLCFRFLYGLRTVMPLTIGLSGYSWRRYLLLDAIGAGGQRIALRQQPHDGQQVADELQQRVDLRAAPQRYLELAEMAQVRLGLRVTRRDVGRAPTGRHEPDAQLVPPGTGAPGITP